MHTRIVIDDGTYNRLTGNATHNVHGKRGGWEEVGVARAADRREMKRGRGSWVIDLMNVKSRQIGGNSHRVWLLELLEVEDSLARSQVKLYQKCADWRARVESASLWDETIHGSDGVGLPECYD